MAVCVTTDIYYSPQSLLYIFIYIKLRTHSDVGTQYVAADDALDKRLLAISASV